MDKQTFYDALSERLTTLGVAPHYIERHMKQFDNYFDGKNEEEIGREIERLGDLDRVAARIKRMTDKIIEQEQATSNEASEEILNEEGNDTPPDNAESIVKTYASNEAADSQTVPMVSDTDTTLAEAACLDEDVITFTPISREELFSVEKEEIASESEGQDRSPALSSSYVGRRRGERSLSDPGRIVKTTLDEQTVRKNTLKFWILFVVTLPITVAILTATAAIFAAIFFIIAVLIIVFVAALVAVTAAGTLVSVFGLIFGAAQMLSNLPIGLYECGLSIIFGASSIFIGILIYNIAVRLLPFIAKWLLVLMKFIFRKYKELYIFLKKECIGL